MLANHPDATVDHVLKTWVPRMIVQGTDYNDLMTTRVRIRPGTIGVTRVPNEKCPMKIWPEFDSNGDLPEGIHQATLTEVLQYFGTGTVQRCLVGQRLECIYLCEEVAANRHCSAVITENLSASISTFSHLSTER